MLLWPGQAPAANGAAAAEPLPAKVPLHPSTTASSALAALAALGRSSSIIASCSNKSASNSNQGQLATAQTPPSGASMATSFFDAQTGPCEDQDDEGDVYFDGDNDDEDQMFETMDDTPARIQPGLFIGSFLCEQNKQKLSKAGVTHVLQVAQGITPSHPDTFTYMGVQVVDSPSEDLVAHFDQAFKFIDSAIEKKGACLVHCVAGVSRSSTVCIGWLMWKHQIKYDEAFRRVHAVRPWVMPNLGFQNQLRTFQEQGCDLAKWRAWRHNHTELPAAVVSLAGLGLGGQGAAGSGDGAGAGAGGEDDEEDVEARWSDKKRSTYVPELGTSF